MHQRSPGLCSSARHGWLPHVKRCRTIGYRIFCEAFLDRFPKRRSSQAFGKKISFDDEILADLYHPRAANRNNQFPSAGPCWKSLGQQPVPSSFGGSPCSIVHAWLYRDLFNGIFCGLWHAHPCAVESDPSQWRPTCKPRSRRLE